MGVVYEAEQQHPRRAVALKVVRGGRYVDEHHVKLFQREAQTLARLKHPHIAAIYEAGRTDDGQHFFAMELVRGVPLNEYVRSKKPSMRIINCAVGMISPTYKTFPVKIKYISHNARKAMSAQNT